MSKWEVVEVKDKMAERHGVILKSYYVERDGERLCSIGGEVWVHDERHIAEDVANTCNGYDRALA